MDFLEWAQFPSFHLEKRQFLAQNTRRFRTLGGKKQGPTPTSPGTLLPVCRQERPGRVTGDRNGVLGEPRDADGQGAWPRRGPLRPCRQAQLQIFLEKLEIQVDCKMF